MEQLLDTLRNKSFSRELEHIWKRATVDRTPLSLMRFGDGEGLLMRGQQVHHETQAFQVDGWSAPEGMTRLGRDLLESLAMTGRNVFIGISDLSRWPGEMSWALQRVRQEAEFITFACLFINANYETFQKLLSRLDEPVVLMASGKTTRRAFPPLSVREFFPMPTDCAHYWEQNSAVFGDELDQLADRHHGALFLVSGGPLAKVAISRMWKANPGNRYLDVGSAIDRQVFGSLTRPDYIGSTRVSTFSLETYYAWKKQNLL